MDEDEIDEGSFYEEEYSCDKCGVVFYMRFQDSSGQIDFDEGCDRCEICHKVYCKKCGNWYSYGDKYKSICEICFNQEIIDNFIEWYDVFREGFCEETQDCDNCPLFFQKGCMMIFFNEMIDMKLKTNVLKQHEIERIQKRNYKTVSEWRRELKETLERIKCSG